jgi:hypothetical protein
VKKVVSVSLWGDNPRYIEGARKNAFLSVEHYSGWEFRIYAEPQLHSRLQGIPATLFPPVSGWANGRFWRFSPAFEADVDVMISRDCDSRIGKREAICVNEWLCSDKKYHAIRDHERHYDFPMLGGLWGVRGVLPQTMKRHVGDWAADASAYLVDQLWLRSVVWIGGASSDVFIHGEKEGTLPRDGGVDFIGQGYMEDDRRIYL